MTRYSLFLAATIALLPLPSHAQDDETFGVWRRTCADGPCQIYLGLRNPDTDETVASIAVVHDGESEIGSLFIEVPTRVALPPGVTLEIGDVSEAIPYQFCRPEGCMAIAAMSSELVDALEDADEANLSFVRYGSGTAEAVRVPVSGFAEGYESLK